MERHRSRFGALLLITFTPIAVHIAGASPSSTPHSSKKFTKKQAKTLTDATRKTFIQRAQVWMPTDIPTLDLSTGPAGKAAFPPDAQVTIKLFDLRKVI